MTGDRWSSSTSETVEFELATRKRRRRHNRLVVTDSGLVIEHDGLQKAVSVPYGEIAGVTGDLGELPDLVLRRPLRALFVLDDVEERPTVEILLRQPRPLGTRRQPRRPVEAIDLVVARPAELLRALQARGVEVVPTRLKLLRDVVGEATGLERQTRLRAEARWLRRMQAMVVAGGLSLSFTASALTAHNDGGGDWGYTGPVTAASLVGALPIAAICFAVFRARRREALGHPDTEAFGTPSATAMTIVLGGLCVVIPFLTLAFDGGALATATVALSALLGGLSIGVVLGLLAETRRPTLGWGSRGHPEPVPGDMGPHHITGYDLTATTATSPRRHDRRGVVGSILRILLVSVAVLAMTIAGYSALLSTTTHDHTYRVASVFLTGDSEIPYGLRLDDGSHLFFHDPPHMRIGEPIVVRYDGLDRILGTIRHEQYIPKREQPPKATFFVPLGPALALTGLAAYVLSKDRRRRREPHSPQVARRSGGP